MDGVREIARDLFENKTICSTLAIEQATWLNNQAETPMLTKRLMELVARGCALGEPFYWEPMLSKAVLQASKTIPDTWQLHEELLPTPTGFCWFPEPLDFGVIPDSPRQRVIRDPEELAKTKDIPFRVGAISWSLVQFKDHLSVSFGFIEDLKTSMGLRIECFDWELNTPIRDPRDNTELWRGPEKAIPEWTYMFCRVIAAGLQFLNQKIAVINEHRDWLGLDRAERRRRLRAKQSEPPAINLVTLRSISREHKEGESHPVDWSRRWLVGGHWRRQWYPSRNHHQPHYILPYVKGPEDKPLIIRDRIFKISR